MNDVAEIQCQIFVFFGKYPLSMVYFFFPYYTDVGKNQLNIINPHHF